ncbi:unnamed protein product [Victoria cruziana]
MGPNEPYWQTNSSFSPPLSSRWDQIFQAEGVPHSARGGLQVYDSSLSSNSKESRGWMRNDHFPCQHYSASDGVVSHFSSPSDSHQTQQQTAALQRAHVHPMSTTVQEPASSSLLFPQSAERPLGFRSSAVPNSSSSTSHSDAKSLRCGICERLLSQRSPWSSVRIVRSGDMPVAGVLSCSHIYHAECLEHNTPKMQKHDPPCPLCGKPDEEIRAVSEQHVLGMRSKTGFPKLKSTSEDGATSSRSWSCGQWGDCVEGTIQEPVHGNLSSLSKHHLKKQRTKRGTSSKDLPESVMVKKRGLFSSKLFNGRTLHPFAASGCSRSAPSVHSLK